VAEAKRREAVRAMDLSAFLGGLSVLLSLIVAIGAQNAFVLREGLRDEHVLAVVLICALSDAVLITLGVTSFGGIVIRATRSSSWARSRRSFQAPEPHSPSAR